jgi:hypothetical protein
MSTLYIGYQGVRHTGGLISGRKPLSRPCRDTLRQAKRHKNDRLGDTPKNESDAVLGEWDSTGLGGVKPCSTTASRRTA